MVSARVWRKRLVICHRWRHRAFTWELIFALRWCNVADGVGNCTFNALRCVRLLAAIRNFTVEKFTAYSGGVIFSIVYITQKPWMCFEIQFNSIHCMYVIVKCLIYIQLLFLINMYYAQWGTCCLVSYRRGVAATCPCLRLSSANSHAIKYQVCSHYIY